MPKASAVPDQIGETGDNIVLLVNRSFGVCQKVVPEIRFGGFQLDHQNSGFRRGSGKFRFRVRGTGGDSRQRRTVAVSSLEGTREKGSPEASA